MTPQRHTARCYRPSRPKGSSGRSDELGALGPDVHRDLPCSMEHDTSMPLPAHQPVEEIRATDSQALQQAILAGKMTNWQVGPTCGRTSSTGFHAARHRHVLVERCDAVTVATHGHTSVDHRTAELGRTRDQPRGIHSPRRRVTRSRAQLSTLRLLYLLVTSLEGVSRVGAAQQL